MKNKKNTQIKNQQMDEMLKKQYADETRILESALLKAAGQSSWETFPKEPEEKIQEGYDRLIAHLKEKGEYKEVSIETVKSEEYEKVRQIKLAEEKLGKLAYEWNKTHRILKPAAAIVTAAMLTALAGMTAAADFQYPEVVLTSEKK